MSDGLGIYIHYGTIALTAAINAVAVGIGQGLTSRSAIEGINRQPAARDEITKAAILGMALIETAAIMGTFMSVMLLMSNNSYLNNYYSGLAELGITFAICSTGAVLGFASSMPARAACLAIARQPFFSQQILRFMMISLSLIETPVVFGLIIALFIQGQAADATTLRDSLRLIGSGLCIGLGSVGPAIGLGLFSRNACEGIGKNRSAYNQIFSFMLVSQAIIETPIIFALIVSISLLFLVPPTTQESILDGVALFSAGLCTAIGTMGPGISSGRTAMAACKQIAQRPDTYGVLSRLSMFAQGLIETAAIYAVLISFMLLFFRT